METHHHQKKTPATVEWTLEHHSIFVDTLLRHGGNEKAAASKVSEEVIKRVKNGLLSRTQMSSHVHQFQRMQRRTQQLLDAVNKQAVETLLEGLTMETTEDESLTKNKKKTKPTMSKWTLENHKRVVDALKKLHGGGVDLVVDKIAPTGKLAVRVLGEMEEERRQGLTLAILVKHLMRLGSLQRQTQRAIDVAAATRAQYGSVWRRLGPRIKTMNYGDDDREAIARILAIAVEAARIRSQLRNTIAIDRLNHQ